MSSRPLTIAWISFFPVEWLPDLPEHLGKLPRQHPATWQRVLLQELESNPGLRLHVVVLRRHFARSETFERHGVVFHLVKTVGGLRASTLFWVDTWLIGRILKRVQPDVVHAWGTESGAALVAARLGYPAVLTMQGLLNWIAEVVPLDRYHRFTALLEGRSLRRATLVTAESSFAVRYLKQRYPHLDLHQVEHAPLPLFQRVTRRPQTEPLRFLFVGSFTLLKGVDVMLHSLDRLKDEVAFELVLVGQVDPSMAGALKSEVSAALWERIRFRGSLAPEQIADELAIATLLIYPTRCDNSPNAVKEAVVAGVPVVASAIGGIVDYVWPDRNGWLFAPVCPEECFKALRKACAHPLFSRGLVEPSSLNETRAYLSAQSMSRRFFEIYRLAAERGNGQAGSPHESLDPSEHPTG